MSRFVTKVVPVAVVTMLSGTVLMGAGQSKDVGGGRYTMHKTDDGFVRLDTQTGALALCRKYDQAWSCRPMADAGASSSSEVEQLRRENRELRAEIKRLDGLLGLNDRSGPNQVDPPRPGGKGHAFRLPSEKEVDKALDYFENMLRKFQDRLKKLERDQGGDSKQL